VPQAGGDINADILLYDDGVQRADCVPADRVFHQQHTTNEAAMSVETT